MQNHVIHYLILIIFLCVPFRAEAVDQNEDLIISTQSETALDVRDEDNRSVFKVDTTGPDDGKRIYMFDNNLKYNGSRTNAVIINGDMSLSGDLFHPAFMELETSLSNVERTVSQEKVLLSELDKHVNSFYEQLMALNDVYNFVPNMLQMDRNPIQTFSFSRELSRRVVSDVGIGHLVNGVATIKLESISLPYYVQVTPRGDSNGLAVVNETATGFTVKEQGGGHSNISFYWRVDVKGQ